MPSNCWCTRAQPAGVYAQAAAYMRRFHPADLAAMGQLMVAAEGPDCPPMMTLPPSCNQCSPASNRRRCVQPFSAADAAHDALHTVAFFANARLSANETFPSPVTLAAAPQVWRCKWTSAGNEAVAVKVFTGKFNQLSRPQLADLAQKEYTALAKLRHKNIVCAHSLIVEQNLVAIVEE